MIRTSVEDLMRDLIDIADGEEFRLVVMPEYRGVYAEGLVWHAYIEWRTGDGKYDTSATGYSQWSTPEDAIREAIRLYREEPRGK